MKRLARRTLSVVLGLALGWYIAGMVPGVSLAIDASHRSDASEHADHHGPAHGDGQVHHAASETDAVHGDHDGEDHGDHDPAFAGAKQLVPHWDDIPWFGPMVWTVVGLFVAAVVLGYPALKLRGPEPSEPADDHAH